MITKILNEQQQAYSLEHDCERKSSFVRGFLNKLISDALKNCISCVEYNSFKRDNNGDSTSSIPFRMTNVESKELRCCFAFLASNSNWIPLSSIT